MIVAAVFEDEDELVLTAVKRAHSSVVFDPDAMVFQLPINLPGGGQQLFGMLPAHADNEWSRQC